MPTPRTLTEAELSRQHLRAELARLDVLIRREVRRWQLAGQNLNDDFRGLYVSDAEADALLERPFGTGWGRLVTLDEAEAKGFAEAYARAEKQALSFVEAAHKRGLTSRLTHLAQDFDLDRFSLDVLLICLAPTLDLRYERLYGYLQDNVNHKRPGVNLVLDLLCEPGPERLAYWRCFSDDAPLFKHRLLERQPDPNKPTLLAETLAVDDAVVAWLLGAYQPQADLGAHADLSQPRPNDADALLATPYSSLLASFPAERPLLIFYGLDHASQAAAARQFAAHQQRALLSVDLRAITQDGVAPLRALRSALRDARLTGAIPFLSGWEAGLGESAPLPVLLAELFAFPDVAIVASRTAWQAEGMGRERRLFWLEFPLPDYPQRRTVWRHFLGDSLTHFDLATLAGQFILTTGQIRDAVASARDAGAQAGREVEGADLFAAARQHSNPRLAALARKLSPRYGWADVILPDEQVAILHEIIATVRGRPQVLEGWGVGQKLASSAGVTVLFAGPPGTGKTMSAEVIAGELGLDIYKIDLSTVISKYIGETEKNLEKIFNEAEASNAILFFDEADAIFGKRSEVRDSHDRYANIEISYLLQRMEAYDGVTILATNLRANMDEAFKRRLQLVVDFPFPKEADRLRIWQALFPTSVPRAPDIDLTLMARRFKLAGGSIRNVIISAAYRAAADGGVVTMDHLLHGTRRELQKMGRLAVEEEIANQ